MSSKADPFLDRREGDDAAIAWLCRKLDVGENPGTTWPITGEAWSAIVCRRIVNKYEPRRSPRTAWMSRHYYVRQLAHSSETEEASAAHVAEIWGAGRPIKAATILAHAQLQANKRGALAWIESICAQTGLDVPPFPKLSAPTYETIELAIEHQVVPALSQSEAGHKTSLRDSARIP